MVLLQNSKTAKFCRLDSTYEAKQVIDIFDQMCDTISDTIESELEYEFFMELTRFIVELKHAEGDISSQVAIALGYQISKIASNEKRLANHSFIHVRNLGKRTTGSNEVRHRNFNKWEDRVTPNSSLTTSHTLTVKGKDEGPKKRKRYSDKVSLTALWHLQNFMQHLLVSAFLLAKKRISNKDDYVHMNNTTWYVYRQDDSLGVGSYTSKTCVLIDEVVDKPAKRDNWATILHLG